MGSGLLSSGYPSELRAQFARSHHDVGGLQVRKLGRYGRNLLRPPECGLGLLPLPLLQKFKEVLKVETLAPIQGALVAVDCSQESLEPTCEFEKFAPGIVGFNGSAHTGMDATGRPTGEAATAVDRPDHRASPSAHGAGLFFVGKHQLQPRHQPAEVDGRSAPNVVPRLEQVAALGIQHHPLPVRKVSALKMVHGVENLVRLVARKAVGGVCPVQIEQALDALAQVAPSRGVDLWRRIHGERFSPDGRSL